MSPMKQGTDLLERVKETLPGLPGFQTLSLFGSLAEGRGDDYSDIDVIVTTDDLPGAKTQLLGLLEQIDPVDFCWVVNLRTDEWNPTVVFRGEGYYHKLDVGLVDVFAADRTIPPEQTVLLCDQRRICGQTAGQSMAYVPEYGSMGHFLLGQLLGCMRYLKARRRGQLLTCYRFAVAAADWRLALKYARMTENPHFRSKLSTDDYLKLDRLLSHGERAVLLSWLDFSDLKAMDATLRIAVDGMLRDGRYLAGMLVEALSDEVIERMSVFLAGELESA